MQIELTEAEGNLIATALDLLVKNAGLANADTTRGALDLFDKLQATANAPEEEERDA